MIRWTARKKVELLLKVLQELREHHKNSALYGFICMDSCQNPRSQSGFFQKFKRLQLGIAKHLFRHVQKITALLIDFVGQWENFLLSQKPSQKDVKFDFFT